jgi:AraC-like DNA-binding protein
MKELIETEKMQVEDKALRYIAKTADGSMRDALSLLDQCIAFHLGQELTYDKVLDVLGAVDTEVFSRLLRFVLERNVLGCVALLEEIVMQGRELTQFVTDFTWYLRNLMLVKSSDDLEDVIQGITTLISERNGYREKMITISPYASHGALHQLLSGNLEGNEIQVLRQEQFLGLRNRYYMVGLVNLHSAGGAGEQRYLDARALTARALEELNTEEMPIAVCPRDLQNLYVVVNGDDPERMTALFYRMLPAAEEAMDDGTMAVTLGVSRPGTELELLREACLEASAALENMILGGRKSVYFYEAGMTGESREYVFPGDLRQRMVKALREGQEQELSSLMDGLWEKNFRKKSLSPEAVRQLVDDLHACVNGALGEISEQSTTHIRAERIREPATIEEIFAYYRSTLTEAVKARREIETGNLAGEELETAICDYVVSNALDPALSLSAVADHFGVSGKMVGSVCKNRTGKTYLQIVHDCRIQESVRLLEETDLSLEEISERCGFGNVLTFRRNFKAAMNKNPSDFRRE